jgi:hypothetical protein
MPLTPLLLVAPPLPAVLLSVASVSACVLRRLPPPWLWARPATASTSVASEISRKVRKAADDGLRVGM